MQKLHAGKFYSVTMPDQRKPEILEVLATGVKIDEDDGDSDSVGIVWTTYRRKLVDWRTVTWKQEDNTVWDGEIEVHGEIQPPRQRIKLRQLLKGADTSYKD